MVGKKFPRKACARVLSVRDCESESNFKTRVFYLTLRFSRDYVIPHESTAVVLRKTRWFPLICFTQFVHITITSPKTRDIWFTKRRSTDVLAVIFFIAVIEHARHLDELDRRERNGRTAIQRDKYRYIEIACFVLLSRL